MAGSHEVYKGRCGQDETEQVERVHVQSGGAIVTTAQPVLRNRNEPAAVTAELIYCHLIAHGEMSSEQIMAGLKLSEKQFLAARHILLPAGRMASISRRKSKKYMALGVV